MICTNTDYYINTLSTIKKEKKKKDLHLEVWWLLKGKLLLEEDTYFNVNTNRCSTY